MKIADAPNILEVTHKIISSHLMDRSAAIYDLDENSMQFQLEILEIRKRIVEFFSSVLD